MAVIPKTQKKLREAEFFVRWLEREARPRIVSIDREVFDYYLSAFLSAGRSVTFVLQAEQKHSYDAWFDNWVNNLPREESQLLKYMNDQRRAEVHVLGANTHDQEVWVPINNVHVDPPSHPAYGYFVYAPPDAPIPEVAHRVSHFGVDGDGGKGKVVDVCKRYFDVLVRIVTDFDQTFR
jgi:hypothetical protein